MNTKELDRRLANVTRRQFDAVKAMYRKGCGMGEMTGYDRSQRKAVNAIIAWVDKYGIIIPKLAD